MHSKLIQKITAPNASMFTGGGTNTYLIGKEEITIVDPGPNIETHINEIANAVGRKSNKDFGYPYSQGPFTRSETIKRYFKYSLLWINGGAR